MCIFISNIYRFIFLIMIFYKSSRHRSPQLLAMSTHIGMYILLHNATMNITEIGTFRHLVTMYSVPIENGPRTYPRPDATDTPQPSKVWSEYIVHTSILLCYELYFVNGMLGHGNNYNIYVCSTQIGAYNYLVKLRSLKLLHLIL